MAKENSVILVLICFAIMYSALSILAVLRTLKMYSKITITQYAKVFYLSVCFESLFRALTFISIVIEIDNIQITVLFLLVSLPDSIFVLIYLLLLIITMIIYYYSHISSALSASLLKKTATKKSKFVKVAVSMMVSISFLLIITYLVFIGQILSSSAVTQVNAMLNIIVPGLGICYIFYLDYIFSGVPTRSPLWKSNLHRICIISIFWTISRIVKGILDLLDESSIVNVVNAVADPSRYSISLMKSAICITVLILSEMVCLFLVLDYGFFGIFIENEADQSSEARPDSKRESFIRENPYITESEVAIIEELTVAKPAPLGKIYKAELRGSQVFYRIMRFSRLSSYVAEEISKEIDSYKGLTVTGLVPVLGIIFHSTTVGIIYPYLKSGSLYKLLHESNIYLSLSQKLEILQKIAETLEDIHSLNRFHGHLTSHNILIEEGVSPVIGDLGFHKMKKYAGVMYSYSYKSYWSAPEILRDNKLIPKVSAACDSYSFGMICWEILTERVPFQGYSEKQLIDSVAHKGLRPLIPSDLPDDLIKIIKSCWNEDPGKRPDFALIAMGLSMRNMDSL